MSDRPSGLSVIILNLNKPELIGPLMNCLNEESTRLKMAGYNFEVLIGDTGSDNATTLKLYKRATPIFRITYGLKYHFSQNNNALSEQAKFSHVLFMNNDVQWETPTSPLLRLMEQIQKNPDCVYGALMYFDKLAVQHAGVALVLRDKFLLSYHPLSKLHVPARLFCPRSPTIAVTGAFLCMPLSVFKKVGKFDENYLVECQDVDLCLKAKDFGSQSVLLNLGHVYHLENSTRSKGDLHMPDRQIFSDRWRSNFRKLQFGYIMNGTKFRAMAALNPFGYFVTMTKLVLQKLTKR
jgi:GT2 family glycosyltransferase